ncbi:uncharacterized protein [Nicotiana sylvestris]|uniref:uncharacterized protein n=1 Tax=Nicotiana sylvestris TaxID=4096 RepID=UPI00388CBB2A
MVNHGGFQLYLYTEDRSHGSEVQEHETKDFKEFIEDCRMNELPTVGRTYIWTNNHVYSRIDRAIVNAAWMVNMPPLQAQIMDPYFSDHSPLSIQIATSLETGKKPFKFFNYLAEHPDFGKIIQENWALTDGKMARIW